MSKKCCDLRPRAPRSHSASSACAAVIRRASWQAPTPEQLFNLASDHDRRLVRSTSELVDVVGEAIQRLQKQLSGSPPAISDVWNTVPGQYRPKEENEISDVITRFLRADLKDRGIVANREVEIRAGREGALGGRSDIHIDAIAHDAGSDVVRIVIEVKGCWHAELKTAMQSQLVDSYLTNSDIAGGLFLVVWFLCAAWQDEDGRKAATARLNWNIEDATAYFRSQVAELNNDHRVLRCLVLDARWPGEGPKPKSKGVRSRGSSRRKAADKGNHHADTSVGRRTSR